MDRTVTGIGSVVVAELRVAGYMESTIGQDEKSIRALTRVAEEHGGRYTPALGAAFASMTTSPRTGRFSVQRRFDYGRLARVFDSYVTTGRVELACRTRGGGGPRPASREFTRLASAWEADMADRALAPATRDAYGRVARGYLVFLESRGTRRLRDADGSSVLGFLNSLTGTWATSSLFWVVSNFRPFLKFAGEPGSGAGGRTGHTHGMPAPRYCSCLARQSPGASALYSTSKATRRLVGPARHDIGAAVGPAHRVFDARRHDGVGPEPPGA